MSEFNAFEARYVTLRTLSPNARETIEAAREFVELLTTVPEAPPDLTPNQAFLTKISGGRYVYAPGGGEAGRGPGKGIWWL